MKGKKDDAGKPPARYFYYAGLATITHRPEILLGYEELLKSLHVNQCASLANTVLKSLTEHSGINTAEVIKNVSYVSQLGATKYGIFNYQNGMKWSRIMDAMGRHILHHTCDDFVDEESGRDHRYHVLANIYMLAYMIEHNVGENDLKETTDEQ